MLVPRTQSTVDSDGNISWHMTVVTVLTLLNDVLYIYISLKKYIFGLNMKDSCLKCKEISIEILYGIYVIKCDNIGDDIVTCDDKDWYHLVAFLPILL